jgi:hypothetical protein
MIFLILIAWAIVASSWIPLAVAVGLLLLAG